MCLSFKTMLWKSILVFVAVLMTVQCQRYAAREEFPNMSPFAKCKLATGHCPEQTFQRATQKQQRFKEQPQAVDSYIQAYREQQYEQQKLNAQSAPTSYLGELASKPSAVVYEFFSDTPAKPHSSIPVQQPESNIKTQKITKPSLVPKVVQVGKKENRPYQVREQILDQQEVASETVNSRIGREHFPHEVALQYPLVLDPNYLAKSNVLVTSQTLHSDTPVHYEHHHNNGGNVQGIHQDQSVYSGGALNYAEKYKITPQEVSSYVSHKYQPIPYQNTEIDTLNSLIGKTPSLQLQGLNALLGQNAHLQHGVGYQQDQREYTPIKEESHDVANPSQKPNINVAPTAEPISYANLYIADHQDTNVHEESRKAYGLDDGNSQYAAKYAFGYRVRDIHTGNDFGHQETRHGDVAKGNYHVLLPDGRVQNVNYHAGPDGYHATVTYHH